MRPVDANAKDWILLFDEGDGRKKVTIEKGEGNFYRVRYWRGNTEASLHLHGESADELAKKLINEAMFTDEEARKIAERIVNPPEISRSQHVRRGEA